jgi:5-methyltetrahydrofolate--homocysteine methyltransferase
MFNLKEISQAVISGDAAKVKDLTNTALDAGVVAEEIVNDGLIAGMNVIGTRFKAREIFIPEVLMAAQALYSGLDLVRPLLSEGDASRFGKCIIGTVKGDVHDIGKNLVIMMLEGAGFEVIDAGIDVTPEKFVQMVKEHKPGVLGLSALLTTTMPLMKQTIAALQEAGLRDSVKVIIGGAPVTQAFADTIGADAYAPDATVGVDKIKELAGVN